MNNALGGWKIQIFQNAPGGWKIEICLIMGYEDVKLKLFNNALGGFKNEIFSIIVLWGWKIGIFWIMP